MRLDFFDSGVDSNLSFSFNDDITYALSHLSSFTLYHFRTCGFPMKNVSKVESICFLQLNYLRIICVGAILKCYEVSVLMHFSVVALVFVADFSVAASSFPRFLPKRFRKPFVTL